jgi:hypothetical protein
MENGANFVFATGRCFAFAPSEFFSIARRRKIAVER